MPDSVTMLLLYFALGVLAVEALTLTLFRGKLSGFMDCRGLGANICAATCLICTALAALQESYVLCWVFISGALVSHIAELNSRRLN